MSEAPSPAPPALPDYELLRLIGRGSYGDVWLARGVVGNFRAVKIVWRNRFADAVPYEREFKGLKEFAAISLVETRQLALLHVGRHDAAGFFYYVMELADDVAGGRDIVPDAYIPRTLKEDRQRRGRLPAREVVALGADLCRALAQLHSRGLVHRDIKPSNVIFVGAAPKLADIGLVATASDALTFVGTEGYVPREGPGEPSADVYALGKVLYELATGLDRKDYPRLPPDLHLLPDEKDLLELNEVIVHACESDPRARLVDASALLEELLLLQAGKSVRRLRSAERRVTRALRVAAVLAVVAGIAGAGVWIERRRANEELVLRQKAEAERDALARRRTYSGNLASAQRSLDSGDLLRARRLLEELNPAPGQTDLRGFEWRVLWRLAQGDPREEIRPAGGKEITALMLSSDESLLAVHDKSDTVTLYDVATRRELRRIPSVWKFSGFSTDGAWIVGADHKSRTLRWAVADGRLEPDPHAPPGLPIAALGATQALILTSEPSPRLRIWDFATRQEDPPIDLGMAPEPGKPPWVPYIADASTDRRTWVRAWVRGSDAQAQFRISLVRAAPSLLNVHRDFNSRPSAVGVDFTGAWVSFPNTKNAADDEVWRCVGSNWEKTNELLPAGTTRLIEYAKGSRIAASDRVLRWLSTGLTETHSRVARGHTGKVSNLAVVGRHKLAFSASIDGGLIAWPMAGPVPKVYRAWDSNNGATRAVFSTDNKSVWVPKDGTTCVLLDASTLNTIRQIRGMRYPVALVNGELIGVGAKSGLVRADPATARLLGNLEASTTLVRIAATSIDGRQIAAIDQSGILLAVRDTGAVPILNEMQRNISMMFDQSGKKLWTVNSTNSELVCVDWQTGEICLKAHLPAMPASLIATENTRHLLIALSNGTVEFRSTSDGVVVRRIDAGSAAPQSIVAAPSENRFFVGADNQIHCFDTVTWEHIHTLLLPVENSIHRLDCSPDGKTLSAITKTGAVHILHAN